MLYGLADTGDRREGDEEKRHDDIVVFVATLENERHSRVHWEMWQTSPRRRASSLSSYLCDCVALVRVECGEWRKSRLLFAEGAAALIGRNKRDWEVTPCLSPTLLFFAPHVFFTIQVSLKNPMAC